MSPESAMRADIVWAWATLGFAMMVPVILWLGRYDRRLLDGVNVWSKPFKFALSLAIHFGTFAMIARYLPEDERDSSMMAITATASVMAGACELAYIALQAARGRHSHFNTSTMIEEVAAILMGVGALIVVSPALVVSFVLMASPPATWPLVITFGIVVGMVGGVVLTLLTASRMGAVRSHFTGEKRGSDRTMPLTGWSLHRADLRPSHFLATHMMQAVPIASLIAARTLQEPGALVAGVLAAIAWTGLTLALFHRTMKGLPLSSLLNKRRVR